MKRNPFLIGALLMLMPAITGIILSFKNPEVKIEHHSAIPTAANLFIITIDGQRWKETFTGIDKTLANDTTYVKSFVTDLNKKYWDNDENKRRELLMPNLWNTIAKEGKIYGNRDKGSLVNVTNPYWFSYPGYAEIFTGFADPLINSNDYPDNPNDNVLEYINNQNEFKGKVVIFCPGEAYKRRLNEKRSGLPINIVRGDAKVFEAAKKYVTKNHPRVCYIALSATDHDAHEKKYDSYIEAVHRADSIIGETWKLIQNDPFYKDKSTLMVTVDHGRGLGRKWTSHNAKTPGSDQIWFAIAGIGAGKPYGEVRGGRQWYQNQFAKTMAALVGLEYTSKQHPVGPIIDDLSLKK